MAQNLAVLKRTSCEHCNYHKYSPDMTKACGECQQMNLEEDGMHVFCIWLEERLEKAINSTTIYEQINKRWVTDNRFTIPEPTCFTRKDFTTCLRRFRRRSTTDPRVSVVLNAIDRFHRSNKHPVTCTCMTLDTFEYAETY